MAFASGDVERSAPRVPKGLTPVGALAPRSSNENGDIFGQIIDNSADAATLARTELEGAQTITLVNPKIGDRITIISDGARYYVEGRTNDTPGLA